MFFATLWALIIGKNAVENGIKDAQLNNWSKQNTADSNTNTYIDASGATREIGSGARVFIGQDLNGHVVKTDIFGNTMVDYTLEKSRDDFRKAKAKRDIFHTVCARDHGRYQDLDDPTKEYVIEYITVSDICTRPIPVYVDVKTALIIRPTDEYLEYISHGEYYDHLKKYREFAIRDMDIINELIRMKNMSVIDGGLKANGYSERGVYDPHDYFKGDSVEFLISQGKKRRHESVVNRVNRDLGYCL